MYKIVYMSVNFLILTVNCCFCRNVQLSLFGKCEELWKVTAAVCLEAYHSNQSSISYWKWTSLPQRLGVGNKLTSESVINMSSVW